MVSSKTTVKTPATTAHNTTESVKQLHYLAAALKAPRITEAASRLAEQARDAGWSFEDYLAAVLEREVSARNASGAQLRIRAAGFPTRKDPRGLRVGHPTQHPKRRRRPGLGRVPHRGTQRRPARPTRHREDASRHSIGDRRGPPRTPGALRDRNRLGHPPHRGPPRRQTPRGTGTATPLRVDHRRPMPSPRLCRGPWWGCCYSVVSLGVPLRWGRARVGIVAG